MAADWTSAVEALPVGLAQLDPDGRVFAANGAFSRLLTLRESPLGELLSTVLARGGGPSLAPDIAADLASRGGRCDFEVADRMLRLKASPVASPPGFCAVLRDITEERRYLRELETLGQRYRLLADSNVLGVIVSGADGVVTYANDAFLTTVGFTRAELEARLVRWDLLTAPENIERDRRATEQLLRTGVVPPLEKEFIRRDGTRVSVLVFAGLVLDQGRDEAVCLTLDLTYRKQLEQALATRAHELAEDARRKDEFLGMLAHELRNPLAAISTTVQMQRRGGDGPLPPQRLAVLERQSRNLTRIVNDLLDVSRISHGKIELQKSRLDAGACVRSCLDGLAPEVAQHRLRLALELPDEPIWVIADPTRLEQIVTNLLGNAVKYTKDGGTIAVSLAADGPESVFVVRDDGIGIEPALLPTVFSPFMQGRQDGRPNVGLGIGLALVHELVRLHEGHVVAESAGLGRGSTFTVRLPRAAEEGVPSAKTAPAIDASAETRPRDVLLVEDNVDARSALTELLLLWGHEVRVAADGTTAIALARERMPEVAFVDIGLVGLDGYATARALRALDGGRQVFLAALTGYGLPGDRRRSAEAGFDRHLVKPIDAQELQTLLQTARRD